MVTAVGRSEVRARQTWDCDGDPLRYYVNLPPTARATRYEAAKQLVPPRSQVVELAHLSSILNEYIPPLAPPPRLPTSWDDSFAIHDELTRYGRIVLPLRTKGRISSYSTGEYAKVSLFSG
jgi:hypothetical protein